MKLKIALAQMRCEKGDWSGNLERAEAYMARAEREGCDVIVLPEMSLSGYCDPTRYPDAAQSLDSEWVRRFVELTARYPLAASGGFIEMNPAGKPFITQVLAHNGNVLGVYRKVHPADDEVALFVAGCETPVFNLPLPGGELTCALAICADSDHADLFATYARQGAQVVFHSSAPGLYQRRTDEAGWRNGFEWYESYLFERLPLWARENQLYIAVATQTGATTDEDFPGGSFVFGPDGTCLARVESHAETLLVCELEIPDENAIPLRVAAAAQA